MREMPRRRMMGGPLDALGGAPLPRQERGAPTQKIDKTFGGSKRAGEPSGGSPPRSHPLPKIDKTSGGSKRAGAMRRRNHSLIPAFARLQSVPRCDPVGRRDTRDTRDTRQDRWPSLSQRFFLQSVPRRDTAAEVPELVHSRCDRRCRWWTVLSLRERIASLSQRSRLQSVPRCESAL